MTAWSERIQPRLHELQGLYTQDLIDLLETDSETALYDNYFGVTTYDEYFDCKIVYIPGKYDFKQFAYGFQKDSPFLDLFNFYLKEMKEKGSLDQIFEKYETKPQVCQDYNGKALAFGNVFTAFGVLCFGGGLAVVLGCIEIIASILGLDLTKLYMEHIEEEAADNNVHQEMNTNIKLLILENQALRKENAMLKMY